jgi:hypothetical protein
MPMLGVHKMFKQNSFLIFKSPAQKAVTVKIKKKSA